MSQVYKSTKKVAHKSIRPNQKEMDMLYFLWRWKLTTTPVIYRKFYNHLKPKYAYTRLSLLEKHKFISFVQNSSGHYKAWALARRGYQAIQYKLPFLESDGFKTENVMHDFLVTTVHQGPWILWPPDNTQITTEQELRRVEPALLPNWVPNPKDHRPDGYWAKKIDGQWNIVALEVETSRKVSKSYELVSSFYNSFPSVRRVLWLVPSLTAARWTERVLTTLYSENQTHNFVLLDPYLLNGWNAEIILGPDKGHNIYGMLCSCLHEKQVEFGKNSGGNFYPSSLLDSRKCSFILDA